MLPSLKTIVRAQRRLWDVGVRHKTEWKSRSPNDASPYQGWELLTQLVDIADGRTAS